MFTSPRNLENARIIARENRFSRSSGIFILEGKVNGVQSFEDLVGSVKEPAKNYAKPMDKDAVAYLVFSSGTTGPAKGGVIIFHLAYCLSYWLLAVMISHKNILNSGVQGSIMVALSKAAVPVGSSPNLT